MFKIMYRQRAMYESTYTYDHYNALKIGDFKIQPASLIISLNIHDEQTNTKNQSKVR